MAVRGEKLGGTFRGGGANFFRQRLQRVGFKNKSKFGEPFARRGKKIRGDVVYGLVRETFAGQANGGFGNVEGGGGESPLGELFGVVAEAAADDECGSGGRLRMLLPKFEEIWVGSEVGPGDGGGAGFGFAVESVEPAGGIVFLGEFGGEFSGADAVAGWVGHGYRF
jgi:hypothetical protein